MVRSDTDTFSWNLCLIAVQNPRAQHPGEPAVIAQVLTKDHKPDDPEETHLIESLGGFFSVS